MKWKVYLKYYYVGVLFECLVMDILGFFLRLNKGNKFLLVVGDYFLKWLDVIFVKD